MASEIRFQCEVCARAFSTKSGLGLHRKRAHPLQFNQGIEVDRFKRRWSPDKMLLLAEGEVRLRREGSQGGLVNRLVDLSGGRSIDSIKELRKKEEYRQLVSTLMGGATRLGRTGQMVPVVEGYDESGIDRELNEMCIALRADITEVSRLRGGLYSFERLVAAAEELLASRDPAVYVVSWWKNFSRGDAMTLATQQDRQCGLLGTPSSVRQRRRLLYAEVQRLCQTDRKAAINRIMGGGKDLGMQTMEEMVQ